MIDPMTKTVTLIHTLAPLIDLFNRLGKIYLPEVRIAHILDEPFLERIKNRGYLAQEDNQRLLTHVLEAQEIRSNLVLVTCSTVSPCVDNIRDQVKVPLMKIDDAMLNQAVHSGPRIGVVATASTTLEPTRLMLEKAAKSQGKSIELSMRHVEGALSALLVGDGERHDLLVKQAIEELIPEVNVVVLAQASMARVLDRMQDYDGKIPVLSSPHLALEQIKQFIQN